MDIENYKISEYDRTFQYRIHQCFKNLNLPSLKPYKGFRLNVSEKDLSSYGKLIFIKKNYASFAKWAYDKKDFNFHTFQSTLSSESIITVYLKLLRSWLKFLFLHCFSLVNLFSKKNLLPTNTVVFMLAGFEDYLDKENISLLDYLDRISIQAGVVDEVKKIIVVCNKEESFFHKNNTFVFTKNLRMIAMKNISSMDLFYSFIETNKVGFYLLMNINKHAYLSNHFDEFFKGPFYAYGINQHVKEVILTNSLGNEPPLFAYFKARNQHNVSCLWYSADYFSYRFSKDDESIIPISSYYFKVDRHFFWTKLQILLYEKASYDSIVTYIDPVILQSNSLIKKDLINKQAIEICLFNIIPFIREHMANYGYPQDHYVSLDRCKLFIADICEVVKEIKNETDANIIIYLKQKRSKNPLHLNDYHEMLIELEERNEIVLLEHNIDMRSLLENTTFSISQPYSTPFFIARELKKDAFFYDPVGILEPCYTVSQSELIREKVQLKAMIKSYIK